MTVDVVESLRFLDSRRRTDRSSTDPDVPIEQDVDSIEDAPDAHVLRTRTVSSIVADEDERTLGHVLMLDYDDVDPEVPVEDARDLDGLAVVSRSSPGSYHVLDLRVDRFEAHVSRADRTRAEESYVDSMVSRGEFVLRVGAKRREQGEQGERPYKAAPVPVAVSPGDVVRRPLSAPHIEVLRELSEDRAPSGVLRSLDSIEETRETVGDLLVRETRRVATDSLRRVLNGG